MTTQINHEAVEPKMPPIELIYCRQDVIQEWDFKSTILKMPYWRLYAPVNDCGSIVYRGQQLDLHPNEVWLIAPDTEFDCMTRGGKVEKMYIHFLAGGEFANCSQFCLRLPDSPILRLLVQTVGERLRQGEVGYRFVNEALALVAVALSLLPSELLITYEAADTSLIEVMRYLRQNPQTKLSNTELAAMARMSRSAFCRKFQLGFGVTPQRYVLNEKLRHAALLLAQTDLSISEVAMAAGFCDRYYFSRMFQKRRNTSPAEFRRRAKFIHGADIGELLD